MQSSVKRIRCEVEKVKIPLDGWKKEGVVDLVFSIGLNLFLQSPPMKSQTVESNSFLLFPFSLVRYGGSDSCVLIIFLVYFVNYVFLFFSRYLWLRQSKKFNDSPLTLHQQGIRSPLHFYVCITPKDFSVRDSVLNRGLPKNDRHKRKTQY